MVTSFDRQVGLLEKIAAGISIVIEKVKSVGEKVKSVNEKLHVSDKTIAALIAAEWKLNDTSTAVKTNRQQWFYSTFHGKGISYEDDMAIQSMYVTAGTAWLNGAIGKVAKDGHIAGSRTREKFQLAISNLTAKDPVVAA
ncbi:RNA recognition motif containing protein [Musa troglodytarum]|uniref:RNA recognition motif containing protein n=1 Tax=Musa troglodytarum TaxID=320322 RepID=A0A9E7FL39_9LILI|nr:RNA recognition motif containing protein [Musa troglodytarum]